METFSPPPLGAKNHSTAIVYSSIKVYYPAHLVKDAYSCLSSGDCYNVDLIKKRILNNNYESTLKQDG